MISFVSDFNSIKVRLEQGGGRSPHRTNNLFQFHKGAIRTSYKMQRWLNGRIFQFHKGAIRTLQINSFITCFSYFNSIKVRLERAPPHRWRFCCLDFNSIKVRLEQSKRVELLIVLVFQFHKGAIRTYLGNYPRTFFVISIP